MSLREKVFMVQHTDPVLLSQRIDEFEELGVGLELRDFMLPSLLDSSEDLAAWTSAYRELNAGRLVFSVHGPVIDLNLGSLDEKIRRVSVDRNIQAFRVAEELSAKFLITHTCYDPRFLKEGDRFKSWVSRSLQSFSEIFRETHLSRHLTAMCVENCPGEPLEMYWSYLHAIRRKFPGIPIRACIDYDHLLSGEKRQLHECLKDSMAAYLHLPWRAIGKTVCLGLPPKNSLLAICFEGEFGKRERKILREIIP